MFALIGWIIIGLLAGFIASNIMGRGGYGVVGDIIVGLVGALVGGFLINLINPSFGMDGNAWYVSLIVAVIGAVILIWVVRMLTGNRSSL